MTDDLMKIPQAIRLSKATLNNIRQNVVIALLTVTALLAGVLIHEASVLVVILNGMRLLRVAEGFPHRSRHSPHARPPPLGDAWAEWRLLRL